MHQFLSLQIQLIYGAMFVFIYLSQAKDSSRFEAFFLSAVIWATMWLLQFLCNAIVLVSRKNHSLLTTHIVEIKDSGLLEETKFNSSLFYWPGLVKVVARPGFIAIYVSSQQAHVIPKRAFSSSAEAERFRVTVLERMQNARSQA